MAYGTQIVNDVDPKRYVAPADALKDRIVLITGAGDGIGKAVALAVAAHGGTVLLLGRTVKKLEAVYDRIVAAGGAAPAIVPFDLERAQADHYRSVSDAIAKAYGRLDGLLHNAALFGARTPIEQFDVPLWNRVLHVNLTAPMILTQTCLPWLGLAKDASVVFTTCDVGRDPRAYWGAYAVSKHASDGLMRMLADEYSRSRQLRFNSIDPGKVRTRRRLETFPGESAAALVEPAAIVAPYLFLLGPAAAGISGRVIDAQ
ncbi:MAG TPA: YciK family oxidoreductase [Steroidobacteraceae bacterium]|nr:YciK family oxidoreductase [Steroidobacteraceae bacterium]